MAKAIVGKYGVMQVRVEEIEGTKDPNRGGARRVDFVIYNADGMRTRLHPGGKPRNDAKPVQCKTTLIQDMDALEPHVEPAAYSYVEPPRVYTREYAMKIPQIDRVGRARMFQCLQR